MSIFHAYDVRGVYPAELDEAKAEKIARAAAKFLNAKKMVIGQDARTSSKALTEAVIKGVTSTGCNVVYIDETTTPMFYFSVNSFTADGGIMVTASHNPAEYNGLKIVGKEGAPIGQDAGLKDIEAMMDEPAPAGVSPGSMDREKIIDDYINFVIELSGVAGEDLSKMRMVVDTSNGMAPLELKNLFQKVPVNVIPLHWDIDETFPHHSPDVSQAKNLEELSAKVRELQADLGVAFDGDGDRVAFVDSEGFVVWPDYILGLLYQIGGGPKTVYDVRVSHSIKELIGPNGVASKVGYANIKKTMREQNAGLGGELSGHFYFKELHYSESAILVMLKMLVTISRAKQPLSDLVTQLQLYAHSGEINIPLATGQDGQAILERIKKYYANGQMNDLDGITVEYDDWWFNVRLSNTEPLLRIVVEANNQPLMEQRRDELVALIQTAA